MPCPGSPFFGSFLWASKEMNEKIYLYDATGRKLRKTVYLNSTNYIQTDYVSGMIYTDGDLDCVLTEEGRIPANLRSAIMHRELFTHAVPISAIIDIVRSSLLC